MRAPALTKIAAIVVTALMFTAGPGWAFEEKPFDMTAFKQAQSEGKSILLDAFAPWCPTCRAQQKVLGALKDDAKYDALVLFKIDYDNQTDVLKTFNVRQQSTLIAFKGDKETGRSVGDTQASSIEALINTALN